MELTQNTRARALDYGYGSGLGLAKIDLEPGGFLKYAIKPYDKANI